MSKTPFHPGELADLFWVSEVICVVPTVHANQVRKEVAVEGQTERETRHQVAERGIASLR